MAAVEPTPEDKTAEEIARREEELEELRDLLRRKQAEFQNYRKRIERERADVIRHASAELVMEILPVLDNLERALQAPETGGERLREGIEIVYRQFRDILTRAGLREVEALEMPFDPHVHEAMGRVETFDHEDGKILEVYQKGYFFKDRLLRPALVNVAQRPKEEAEPTEGETAGEPSPEGEEVESDATRS